MILFGMFVSCCFEKQEEKTQVVPRQPHEIFSALLEWKVGDEIIAGGSVLGVFLGVLDGSICIESRLSRTITQYSPIVACEGNFLNSRVQWEKREREYERIKQGISQDQYNEFLAVVREKQNELWETWTPKELKQ